jgi:lambda family phage portal protein
MWPFRKRPRKTSRFLPVQVIRAKPARRRFIEGRYDAAQTTTENIRHWALSDGLSADSANNADVRRKLRERARYEVANNSYAKGIVLTISNDTVGTGPRLQMLTEDSKSNHQIEQAFANWAQAVNLAEKLRTMRMAKTTDGEVFAVLTANFMIDSPIKLDVRLIEADCVASSTVAMLPVAGDVDGIRFDPWGNPASYNILRYHPGDLGFFSRRNDYDILDAADVIHYFRSDRPGQHRGVPEITPAIPLFAQLRRYTLAVIAAAETAADFASVLYTDSPANGEAAAVEPMDIIELEKRMMTTLPDGWKLGQTKAEQPATTYDMFKREILNEIARCLNLPYNIAACNSSGYNYASGRLDHQTYYKSIRVEQAHLSAIVLDRIFQVWCDEAMLTSELAILRNSRSIPHQWFFDGTEHVDPAKEANAQATRIKSLTTTRAAEFARQGKDWETELRQIAKEKRLMDELDLSQTQPLSQETKDSEKITEDEVNEIVEEANSKK